mmetsp:Transcript_2933/g.8371  ORF Transcript_2933/g.8371 Transcript_2933/m.8371 type:complete len:204 (+) Transcript_2933:2312-2923(+)
MRTCRRRSRARPRSARAGDHQCMTSSSSRRTSSKPCSRRSTSSNCNVTRPWPASRSCGPGLPGSNGAATRRTPAPSPTDWKMKHRRCSSRTGSRPPRRNFWRRALGTGRARTSSASSRRLNNMGAKTQTTSSGKSVQRLASPRPRSSATTACSGRRAKNASRTGPKLWRRLSAAKRRSPATRRSVTPSSPRSAATRSPSCSSP